MKAQVLKKQAAVTRNPLVFGDIERPMLGAHDVLIKVSVCGVCHTDLHTVEGDLPIHKQPVVPGHQIVGIVDELGEGATRFKRGDRVGVPWLNRTDGECGYCKVGLENLCEHALFTGYDVNGGYAEYQVTDERFACPIPEPFSDEQAAPLLCAGVIGYRAIKLSGALDRQRVGLYGFGSSAHIVIQLLCHSGVDVWVFTRSPEHQRLAMQLGAVWAGNANDDPGELMQSSIIFAPAGRLVPIALSQLAKAGTLTLAGIHMSPIPEMPYELIWGERIVRSVANSTRQDVQELLSLAADVPVRTEVEVFPLEDANQALNNLKASKINGSAVLRVGQ